LKPIDAVSLFATLLDAGTNCREPSAAVTVRHFRPACLPQSAQFASIERQICTRAMRILAQDRQKHERSSI